MGFSLTTENIATLLIDGSTIFLLLGVITQTTIMRKRGRKEDKLFFGLILLTMVVAVADIVTYLADEKHFPGARILNLGGVTVFYMALILGVMGWFHYCVIRFGGIFDEQPKLERLLLLPGSVIELLLLINLFTGLIFYVDESNVYHYGILFISMFIIMGVYLLSGLIVMGMYRSKNDNTLLIPVWIFLLPITAGIVVPFVIGGISLTSIGLAMSVVFIHAGSASEIVNYDTEEESA